MNILSELKQLLSESDDLNEPECMDKILLYLEEIKEEDEMFMELLMDKLAGEEITWRQPWYQQTNSVSRPLKECNESQTHETYKTDTICKAENDQIVRNWQQFMEEYDVPDKLICLARWKNKVKSKRPNTPEECARRFLISYLAQGLQRTTFQVFRHIQTYFGGPVKGAYSPVEEKIMELCFTHHPNHAVVLLSMVLSREPRGIYRRLQQMYNGRPERNKPIKWTLPLATKLLKRLIKHTGLPLEELKHRKFDKEIWLKLEEDMAHNYILLQHFWYYSLHVQLFVKHSVRLKKLKKKILNMLRGSTYEIWSDIRWKDVLKTFPEGYTHHFLYTIGYRLIAKRKPKYHRVPLPELLDLASISLKYSPKRRLRTLVLNDKGELEVIVYKKSKGNE